MDKKHLIHLCQHLFVISGSVAAVCILALGADRLAAQEPVKYEGVQEKVGQLSPDELRTLLTEYLDAGKSIESQGDRESYLETQAYLLHALARAENPATRELAVTHAIALLDRFEFGDADQMAIIFRFSLPSGGVENNDEKADPEQRRVVHRLQVWGGSFLS